MEKIIIRKKIVNSADSKFMRMYTSFHFNNIGELVEHYGNDFLLTELYLENSNMFEILNAKANLDNNEFFDVLYKIDNHYAVSITHHIILYRIERLMFNDEPLFRWYYAFGKMYIGDSWWESDEEILSNIQSLPIVEFFRKYKGF